jgi:hypothetical protein
MVLWKKHGNIDLDGTWFLQNNPGLVQSFHVLETKQQVVDTEMQQSPNSFFWKVGVYRP